MKLILNLIDTIMDGSPEAPSRKNSLYRKFHALFDLTPVWLDNPLRSLVQETVARSNNQVSYL